MKKEIRVVDTEKQLVQITSPGERWYVKSILDETTGVPRYQFVPSVTWICEFYPRGIAFYKWLANTGWDEAEALKTSAGDKGSKVHQAAQDLFDGKSVAMNAKYMNNSTQALEELTLDEYECLMSLVAWLQETQPQIIDREFVVWQDADGFAGTVDLLCRIAGQWWLIDLKTSQSVWPSHELQVSAYGDAWTRTMQALLQEQGVDIPVPSLKLGILQLGYQRNKARWKLTEIIPQYDLFLASKQIWAKETAGQTPLQRDYPLSLTAPTVTTTRPTETLHELLMAPPPNGQATKRTRKLAAPEVAHG